MVFFVYGYSSIATPLQNDFNVCMVKRIHMHTTYIPEAKIFFRLFDGEL